MYIKKLTLELVRSIEKDDANNEYPCFCISLNIEGDTSDMISESMVDIVNGFCKNVIDLEELSNNSND